MRTAACSCGQLSISLEGDPHDILICHCRECQKAMGAPFGVSTYWSKEAIVDIRGNSQTFHRVSDAGRRRVVVGLANDIELASRRRPRPEGEGQEAGGGEDHEAQDERVHVAASPTVRKGEGRLHGNQNSSPPLTPS